MKRKVRENPNYDKSRARQADTMLWTRMEYADIVGQSTNYNSAWHMTRHAVGLAKLTTSEVYADQRGKEPNQSADKCRQ